MKMAIIRRENARGIDAKIDVLQTHLYDFNAFTAWQSSWSCHDRANLVPNGKHDGKLKAMTYRSGEYTDVYMDDSFNIVTFFTAPKKRPVVTDLLVDTTVSMYLQCNLSGLFPEASHRADEEVINRFIHAFHRQPEFRLAEVVTTIDEVYRGLDTEKLMLDDIGKWLALRFDLEVSYEAECF